MPALRRLSGESIATTATERAVLGAPLPANDRRADFLRASLRPGDPPVAVPAPVQDSSMLNTLAHSDALILRAPFAPAIGAGAEVQILRFASLGV
jgi:molybdopterin molybdotransferase